MNHGQIRVILKTFLQNQRSNITLDYKDYNELINVAQLKHFKRKIGLPEEYQPGMPLPRQSIEITQKIEDDLRIFKVNYGDDQPVVKVINGKLDIPDDYYIVSTLSVPVKGGERNIEIVSDTQWNDRLDSKLIAPRKRYPICNFQHNFIRFSPPDIKYVKFIYYRYPKEAVYAVKRRSSYNAALFPEYDPDNSVELEWDDINIIDIIHILLTDLSIVVNKKDIANYANVKTQQGI